jgi:hypothetical protein
MNSKAPSDLGSIELGMIKRLDKQNEDKLRKLHIMRRRNNLTALGITGIAFGICEYLMMTM